MEGPAPAPAARTGGGFRPGDRKRLRFTREGWYYTAFTVGVGVAALNTGNNLLFLVLGLQLTAILVSGVLSETALAELEIARELPSEPCAGDAFLLGYRVVNHKRFWPTITLWIEERGSVLAGARASLLQIAPGASAQVTARARLLRRGRVELTGVRLATRFPFGLFEKSQEVALPAELWVLPRRVPARERRAQGGYRDGERPENRPGEGAEFHGLRELRPGDDRRIVHWRKSASAGRLLAIEREREHRRRVTLVLDNRAAGDLERLDRRVEQAAALARALSGRGLEVGLAASALHLAPEAGPVALRRLLRALAALPPAGATAPAPQASRDGLLPVDWETS